MGTAKCITVSDTGITNSFTKYVITGLKTYK
jgi:hypothetical protein